LSEHPIVIIGSGLAGYTTAKEFRLLDKNTPLQIFSKQEACFYSKPLLSTALAHHRTPSQLAMMSAQQMTEQLNAAIYSHTAVEYLDVKAKQVVLKSEEKITYSRCVLACGSEVIQPLLTGDAADQFYSVNDLEAYERFRGAIAGKKKIVILGSGFVGCEFANDLIMAGYEVTVVSMDAYPLWTRLPSEIGKALQQALSEQGVQWIFNARAEAIDKKNEHLLIRLSDQSQLEAEVILSAVGIRPVLQIAKASGLNTHRGVVVNEYLQTSDPHVYALGDCAEVSGQTQWFISPLLHCAKVLAQRLAGKETQVNFPIMPILVKTPACAISFVPPPACEIVRWEIKQENSNLQALCYSERGTLCGFALTGQQTPLRQELIRSMSEKS